MYGLSANHFMKKLLSLQLSRLAESRVFVVYLVSMNMFTDRNKYLDTNHATFSDKNHTTHKMKNQSLLSSVYAALVLSACFIQGYSLPQQR